MACEIIEFVLKLNAKADSRLCSNNPKFYFACAQSNDLFSLSKQAIYC